MPHQLHAETLARLITEVCPTPCVFAEVGVFRGDTSAYLLANVPQLQRLWLVDRWDAEPFRMPRNKFSLMAKHGDRWHAGNEAAARRAVRFAEHRVKFVRGDFRDAALEIEDESLDGCFLDAAHSFQDTWDQIEIYDRKVKPGGLVAGHDYDYPSPGYECVARAVDRYAAQAEVDLRISPGYVWWFLK